MENKKHLYPIPCLCFLTSLSILGGWEESKIPLSCIQMTSSPNHRVSL